MTQSDLGLDFDSIAVMLGYDPQYVDECAIEAIENEMEDRKREYERQQSLSVS